MNGYTQARPGQSRFHSTAVAISVGIAIILLMAYVLGYFIGGEASMYGTGKQRAFSAAWQANLYFPAARLESVIFGIPVRAVERWDTVHGAGTIAPFPPIECHFPDDGSLEQETPAEGAFPNLP
jgi:hypothetical protein